jgi:hypothetical protein
VLRGRAGNGGQAVVVVLGLSAEPLNADLPDSTWALAVSTSPAGAEYASASVRVDGYEGVPHPASPQAGQACWLPDLVIGPRRRRSPVECSEGTTPR